MTRLILCLALAACLVAADEAKPAPTWHTDLAAATALATKEKKPLLIDFTGSDWCGWCIKLKKEVFATPEFATWAAKTVVLVEIDFPRKAAQPEAVKQANMALAQKYGIEGFPTIVLTDATGKELGRLGYQQGGPQAWTAAADKLLPAKP